MANEDGITIPMPTDLSIIHDAFTRHNANALYEQVLAVCRRNFVRQEIRFIIVCQDFWVGNSTSGFLINLRETIGHDLDPFIEFPDNPLETIAPTLGPTFQQQTADFIWKHTNLLCLTRTRFLLTEDDFKQCITDWKEEFGEGSENFISKIEDPYFITRIAIYGHFGICLPYLKESKISVIAALMNAQEELFVESQKAAVIFYINRLYITQSKSLEVLCGIIASRLVTTEVKDKVLGIPNILDMLLSNMHVFTESLLLKFIDWFPYYANQNTYKGYRAIDWLATFRRIQKNPFGSKRRRDNIDE